MLFYSCPVLPTEFGWVVAFGVMGGDEVFAGKQTLFQLFFAVVTTL